MSQEQSENKRTLREEARKAKNRIKSGFWDSCQQDMEGRLEKARKQGLNESKAERYFTAQVAAQIEGKKEDDFYLRVKELLLTQGEVSDAIGQLTDKEYYATLSYEEQQRYTLTLSERYLRALERFRAEYAFETLTRKA